MNDCTGCIHNHYSCGYFDLSFSDFELTEEERFEAHCVGCCCGDGCECNRTNNYGCMNWEDGSGPLLG